MPANVPSGIDLLGFFKSPDKPTPAVIPVKAGNIIAKTAKKPISSICGKIGSITSFALFNWRTCEECNHRNGQCSYYNIEHFNA